MSGYYTQLMSAKDVKSPVLPQKVSGVATPSKPRPELTKQQIDKLVNVYLDSKIGLSTDDVTPPDTPPGTPPKGRSLVRLEPPGSTGKDLGKSQIHPLLAELGFTGPEIQSELRSLLIEERSKGKHEGSLADWKHFYYHGGAIFNTTNQQEVPFARIAGGTSVSSRTGTTISLRKMRYKIAITRTPTATSTTVDIVPFFQMVIFRDKIPTTPGTCPNVWIPGANPPTDTAALFDQLGGAALAYGPVAIRNPITEDAYHIYEYKSEQLSLAEGYQVGATGFGAAAPKIWHFEGTIDLNDVQQTYATYATSQSDINDLWLVMRVNTYSAAYSFVDNVVVHTDLEFEDIQD